MEAIHHCNYFTSVAQRNNSNQYRINELNVFKMEVLPALEGILKS